MENSKPAVSAGKKQSPRWWKILKNILFYAALAIILVFASFSIAGRVNGGTLRFGNDEVRIVLTGSMDGEPTSYSISTIKTGSAVVITDVPTDDSGATTFYANLEVGDVLTFHYAQPNGSSVLVTHRIIGIEEKAGSSYVYTLKGDNDSGIQRVTSDSGFVVGKVKSVSYGWGVFLTFLTGRWGLGLLVVLPACCICCYEVGKIIYLVRDDKKKEAAAKQEADAKRIQELERQVASLKKSDNAQKGVDDK
jgi:signal peptidase I